MSSVGQDLTADRNPWRTIWKTPSPTSAERRREMAKRKPKSSLVDDARDLLINAAADDFARALDLCGWMIVPQPEYASYPDGLWKPKWRMNYSSPDCPVWAANAPDADPAL